MTQEEILMAVEARLSRYRQWRKENDKHRQDDNSFPYSEEGYESAFEDILSFLKQNQWRWPL